MRLSPAEIAAIKAAACEAFGGQAVVRVFGSRLDRYERFAAAYEAFPYLFDAVDRTTRVVADRLLPDVQP